MASNFRMRLEKLEARVPVSKSEQPTEDAGASGRRIWAVVERIKAETARIDALPPAQKILHYRSEIARNIAEAALPPKPCPPGRVDLSRNIHALLVQDVKGGFPSEQHLMRGCEIELLKKAGYDTQDLAAAHAKYANFPWQWQKDENPIPAAAQAVIEKILDQEANQCKAT